MKIIFNSDILYASSLIKDQLHKKVHNFLGKLRDARHEVIIPLTTLLEFNRIQDECLAKEITELNHADSRLRKYGVQVGRFNASDLVAAPDLIALINNTGVTCTLEEPTLDDFRYAHEKTCSRKIPHPPNSKSDEMRDLVIWEIALRIAENEDCTLLLSRDTVHTHHRGDSEASAHGLIRCNSFERAYESLDIATASSLEVRRLVDRLLPNLVNSELPLVAGAQLVSVKRPTFIDSDNGSTTVNADASFSTGDGHTLKSKLTLEYIGDNPFRVEFKNMTLDDTPGNNFCYQSQNPEFSRSDLDDKISKLRELLGD